MKKYITLFAFVSLLFAGYLSATEPEPTNAKPVPTPAIPKFEAGNKVYLTITGNVQRMVITLSAVGKNENKNKGFSKDDGYPDNLIPYDENVLVQVFTRTQRPLRMTYYSTEVKSFNAKELLDKIAEKIKENPKDKTKWQWQWNEREATINFQFAGIQRFFRLESIEVPRANSIQMRSRYNKTDEEGLAPRFHLFIDVNGVLKKDIPTDHKGWHIDFPRDASSLFELREGMDEAITLRLKDRNTWTTRLNLIDIGNITFADIQSGTIHEKLNDYDDKKSAIELKFSEVK